MAEFTPFTDEVVQSVKAEFSVVNSLLPPKLVNKGKSTLRT